MPDTIHHLPRTDIIQRLDAAADRGTLDIAGELKPRNARLDVSQWSPRSAINDLGPDPFGGAPRYIGTPLEEAARDLLESSRALRQADSDIEDAEAALEASRRAQELARQAIHDAQARIHTIAADAR